MASVSLRDLFGYVKLTQMVKTNVPDLPKRLPPAFYNGTPEKVERDMFRFSQFTHARTIASTTTYGSPAVAVQPQDIGDRTAKLFHTNESFTVDAQYLEALREFASYDLQERGKEWLTLQVAEFRRRFQHLRDILALLIATQGRIYRTSGGLILPSSSGADTTLNVDMGVPAGNRGTIAALTGVGGAWNSPTTNIPLQLETMRIKAQQAHGYIPQIILYGKNVPTYLTNNDHVIPYLSRNGERRDQWLKDGYIKPNYDLFGYEWYSVSDAGWRNTSGTYVLPVGDDDITILPMADPSWWGWAEGSYTVPTNLNVKSGVDDLLAGTAKVYGQFGYSLVEWNPVRMVAIMGDTCLPFCKIPEVMYFATAI